MVCCTFPFVYRYVDHSIALFQSAMALPSLYHGTGTVLFVRRLNRPNKCNSPDLLSSWFKLEILNLTLE